MLDLCVGLGGASAAMRDRGWKVIGIDIEPKFKPDIVADVIDWSWYGERPDLVWASPPCYEFSREWMPWIATGIQPDLAVVDACKRIIEETQPRYWIIENVRGAMPYLGAPNAVHGPYYLWGFFPPLGDVKIERTKQSFAGQRPELRAKIPYTLSLAVAVAIERQAVLI